MHRCLHISEIVYEILEHLTADAASKGALSVLARTSKAFLEPALDVLWRDLDTLVPLVNCLPMPGRVAWWFNSENPDESSTRIDDLEDIRCPFSAEDWIRFDFYAKRVKSFKWEFHTGGRIYNAFNRHRPSEAVMPNLTHLAALLQTGDKFGNLVPFFGPKLRSLSIVIPCSNDYVFDSEPSPWIYNAIGNLRFQCPLLETVAFENDQEGEFDYEKDYFDGVSQIICALPPIRSFSTKLCITHRAFTSLAMMPDLERADIMIGADNIPFARLLAKLLADENGQDPPDVLFPAIKSLSLSYWETVDLTPATDLFLSMRQRRNLEEFRLHAYDDGHQPRSMCQLLAAVARASSRETLHTISVDTDPSHYDPLPAHLGGPITMPELLKPVHAFPNLRVLEISIAIDCTTFTDDMVVGLAQSFPHLEKLQLWGMDAQGSLITYEALRILARHCPSILHIEFPVNPQALPGAPDAVEGHDTGRSTSSHQPPVYMCFGNKAPGAHTAVITFVNSLFSQGVTISGIA